MGGPDETTVTTKKQGTESPKRTETKKEDPRNLQSDAKCKKANNMKEEKLLKDSNELLDLCSLLKAQSPNTELPDYLLKMRIDKD